MNKVNKLLNSLNETSELSFDNWTVEHQFVSGMRKWISNILPVELLSRSVKQTVESLVTLSQDGIFYKKFPNDILTPDYGDNWGVSANYIEINNRASRDER